MQVDAAGALSANAQWSLAFIPRPGAFACPHFSDILFLFLALSYFYSGARPNISQSFILRHPIIITLYDLVSIHTLLSSHILSTCLSSAPMTRILIRVNIRMTVLLQAW